MAQANIWMQSGPYHELNYIIVGLGVGLSHNDINPRLFTFWSNNGGESGCYNLPFGFIKIDSEIATGHLFIRTSKFDGCTVDVKIIQDKATTNWLLSVLDEDIAVGYFPPKYFRYLKSGAQTVAWGGATYIGKDRNSPPMGSGHLPYGIYNHAPIFINSLIFTRQFVLRKPSAATRFVSSFRKKVIVMGLKVTQIRDSFGVLISFLEDREVKIVEKN
ncbi:hypothetical protein Patl1_36764 [Pistacia atlantica]|nr:hypothetical protein Patl1_36764 [Pistacia atlantica]